MRVMVAAIANPLEPHPVVAFAATCNFIHTALATPPRPDELSELGKLHESYLATCTLCRKAGTRCAAVCCAEKLSWQAVGITAQDAAGLTVLLQFSPVLNKLYLDSNRIGDTGASAIAEAIKGNPVMTYLNLGGNEIGDTGATSIGKALEVNRVLKELSLRDNNIGDAGATAIGKALEVNRALNTLWLSGNQISDNGKQALRAVVQGRVGFDLEL